MVGGAAPPPAPQHVPPRANVESPQKKKTAQKTSTVWEAVVRVREAMIIVWEAIVTIACTWSVLSQKL